MQGKTNANEKPTLILEIIILVLQIKPTIFKRYISSKEQKEQNFPFFNFFCEKIIENPEEKFFIMHV